MKACKAGKKMKAWKARTKKKTRNALKHWGHVTLVKHIKKTTYSFVPNCRGSRIKWDRGKLLRFLKKVKGVFLAYSLMIIK